jgi:hypothetical protein
VLEVGAGPGGTTVALVSDTTRSWTCLEPDPEFGVLERIEDDGAEIERARDFLSPGGRGIKVSPAHEWLDSPFDRAIGHQSRYSIASLEAMTLSGLAVPRSWHPDRVGMLLSLGNRMLLRASHPTQQQIDFGDRVVVPLSERPDPLLGHRVGKSVALTWRRNPD